MANYDDEYYEDDDAYDDIYDGLDEEARMGLQLWDQIQNESWPFSGNYTNNFGFGNQLGDDDSDYYDDDEDGNDDHEPCVIDKDALNDIIRNIQISFRNHTLIIAGGLFTVEDNYWIPTIISECDKVGVTYDIVPILKSTEIMKKFSENTYNSCIVLGIGSGGPDDAFFNPNIKSYVVNWVSKGGRLLIQGERKAETIFNAWFNLGTYSFASYQRFITALNFQCKFIPNDVKKRLKPIEFHGKSCSFMAPKADVVVCDKDLIEDESIIETNCDNNVELEEGIITFTAYNKGYVGFFGDVNGDECTVSIIIALASFSTTSFNYDRRASFIQVLSHSKMLHDNLFLSSGKISGKIPYRDSTVVDKVLSTKGLVHIILSYL